MSARLQILPDDRDPCICTRLRQAARAVSQMYDNALDAAGLTITGYALLARIDKLLSPSMNELADASVMDRSTLSRNLKPLTDAKLIATRAGEDRRRKVITLTAKGRKTLADAYPRWQDAQERFKQSYGALETGRLSGLLSRAIALR
jgi:DNA-binding MarR family transcriptional regulator